MQACEIVVNVSRQQLEVINGGEILRSFPVSTALAGTGCEPGSNKTPTGLFRISEAIGAGAPAGAVFRSRVPTGEFADENSEEDLVCTRILWLDGLEPHNANTHERYIYIHGTNQESQLGVPASHGCVRMANADIIELFEIVKPGTMVRIA